MNTAHRLRELTSLQAIRDMVAQHLAGSSCCTGVVLETVYRHEQDRTGCNWDASYWNAGNGNVLPCRASVFEEIELLRQRFNVGDGVVKAP